MSEPDSHIHHEKNYNQMARKIMILKFTNKNKHTDP